MTREIVGIPTAIDLFDRDKSDIDFYRNNDMDTILEQILQKEKYGFVDFSLFVVSQGFRLPVSPYYDLFDNDNLIEPVNILEFEQEYEFVARCKTKDFGSVVFWHDFCDCMPAIETHVSKFPKEIARLPDAEVGDNEVWNYLNKMKLEKYSYLNWPDDKNSHRTIMSHF
jgi:hypothetical protein